MKLYELLKAELLEAQNGRLTEQDFRQHLEMILIAWTTKLDLMKNQDERDVLQIKELEDELIMLRGNLGLLAQADKASTVAELTSIHREDRKIDLGQTYKPFEDAVEAGDLIRMGKKFRVKKSLPDLAECLPQGTLTAELVRTFILSKDGLPYGESAIRQSVAKNKRR